MASAGCNTPAGAAAAGPPAPAGAVANEDLIEGLSERKKSLLEARIFGKPPTSLDGLSTGTRSASSSPAAFHRMQQQQQQQHQFAAAAAQQQHHHPQPPGHGRGASPVPPPSFSAQRSAGTEPTILDMTDSNSRSQQQPPPHPLPLPVPSSASREGLPPSGKQASSSSRQAAPAAAAAAAAAVAAAAGAVVPPAAGALPQQDAAAQAAARAAAAVGVGGPYGSPAANRKLFGGKAEASLSGVPAPPLPQLPAGHKSLQRTRSDTSGGVIGGYPGAGPPPPPNQQTPSSASAAAAAAAGGRKRPRSNSNLTIDPSPPPQHAKVAPSPSPTEPDAPFRPSSISPARLGGDGSGGPASGSNSNQGAPTAGGAGGGSNSSNNKFRTIESYFTQRGGGAGGIGGGGVGGGEEAASLRARVAELERQLQEVGGEAERARREKEEQEHVAAGLREELARVREEGGRVKEAAAERERRAAAALEEALRRLCGFQDRETREQLARNSHRLGRIVTSRSGPHGVTEVWEEGTALKELQRQSAELLQRKEELDKRRRQIAKESKRVQASLAGGGSGDGASGSSNSVASGASAGSGAGPLAGTGGGSLGGGEQDVGPYDELQILEAEEGVRMHLGQLKKDEAAVQEARRALEREKSVYVRELRRVQHEDRSRFARRPVLHGRYLLLSLLGRGGFSEVWKAFDLRECCEMAVKIHQLNSAWAEEKKQNYMKHATREYAIHREMSHPRVVRLFDVFEIDSSSFATVLEYCKGTDLDYMIKTQKVIPERDARAIMMQILAGLRYLNTPSGSRQGIIIHYDLKPGNVLFDENGDVKITDFGLSKIVDDSCGDGHSMELTSQGAGTYWYLPPECFVMGSSPPRISSKVDVWALGVIFYQMLFGCRPFGEGQSQEKVLHENTMLRATHVNFPPKPPVSNDAKEFIRACLTHSQADRPDVLRLCQHPYLRLKKL